MESPRQLVVDAHTQTPEVPITRALYMRGGRGSGRGKHVRAKRRTVCRHVKCRIPSILYALPTFSFARFRRHTISATNPD